MNRTPQGQDERSSDHGILETMTEPLQQVLKRQARIESAKEAAGTRRFQPVNRQPLALLTILDDGSQESGQSVRIRDVRVRIGRREGDVVIPFDYDMSSRHAELRCRRTRSGYRWYLVDQDSRNGTFVRAFRASLFRDTELLLGGFRYRFSVPMSREYSDESAVRETRSYTTGHGVDGFRPKLSRIGPSECPLFACELHHGTHTLGRATDCDISIPDDPLLSSRHARLTQDERDRWHIEDLRSLNGIWVRVRRLRLDHPAEFQLGQQRFRFQPTVAGP